MRSSHYKRTILTAKSFLAGVFHESIDQDQNKPFKINVHKQHGDFLIRNSSDCKHMIEMNKYLSKLELYNKNEDYIQNLKELNRAFGTSDKKLSFSDFWDDISARKVNLNFKSLVFYLINEVI